MCPNGWLTNPTNNQCYFKSTTALAWDDAELDCISKNAHLISINTQDEFDYFNSIRETGVASWVFNSFFYFKLKFSKLIIFLYRSD